MFEVIERKVGIVACSGEELAEGTVARLAALKVLNELRPRQTVTICLPLFLAGGAGDRTFARVHPTITVDGCDLRCAARATEMYSSKPATSIVVNEVVAERGLERPEGRRRLNAADHKAVEVVAERVAALVDTVLWKEGGVPAAVGTVVASTEGRTSEVACSCGSGVPETKLDIGGETAEFVALPLIFQKFREAGRPLDETAGELFETVKIYNTVLPEGEARYREAVLREYAAYCQQERQP